MFIAKQISEINVESMQNKNNELSNITEVLNEFNINDIGQCCGFCVRKRVVRLYELVMALVTAMG